ncbi:MAG: hypothetical protein ABI835_02290 [Chloroflexota bacterium]
MTTWQSLYLPCAAKVVAETLHAALGRHGYAAFNPFGLLPGKTYPQAVRVFVAPARAGWTRIIGGVDRLILPELSLAAPCLLVALDGAEACIEAYAEGESAAPEIALMTYAHEHDCIHLALEGTHTRTHTPSLGGVALDALPSDIQAMAAKLDPKQAETLFARISGTIAQKSGTDPAAAEMLRQPDWNSAGGARISALMECLRIPEWRTPDFVTLRDAYALHKRRERSPNATLYPGDAEALAAVPNALDYTPVYAGKA